MTESAWPKWRYHRTCPDGKIFYAAEDVPDGWVDTPAKIHSTETRPKLTPLPNWNDDEDEQPRRGRPRKVK